MIASIAGIQVDNATPGRMCIKPLKSRNLKIKLFAIDKNTQTIRVQGRKDEDAKEYFARDLLSVHVKRSKEGSQVLVIGFISGLEIELFEASQKDVHALEAFREELVGFLGNIVRLK
ncbi:MAG: hypothetical protein GYA24_17770 [Candidatus Lokiarchaeota archaeon]|nr:hypothetical protein [Candidatus Lokiarchaeota archaeon]